MMPVTAEITKEDMLAGRLVVYADLAQCFYYPAKPVISLLKGEMESHLPLYELVGLDLKPHLDAIRKWMQGYEEVDSMLLDLRREYTRLFIIAKPKVPAPPYGSLYLEKDWLVWGKTTVEAVKLYAESGLKMSENFKDIPDHFATELEFMWYLIREEIRARGGMDPEHPSAVDDEKAEKMADLQRTFLQNHIGAWYEDFLERMRPAAGTVFYREVCAMAGEFISKEMSLLEAGVKENP